MKPRPEKKIENVSERATLVWRYPVCLVDVDDTMILQTPKGDIINKQIPLCLESACNNWQLYLFTNMKPDDAGKYYKHLKNPQAPYISREDVRAQFKPKPKVIIPTDPGQINGLGGTYETQIEGLYAAAKEATKKVEKKEEASQQEAAFVKKFEESKEVYRQYATNLVNKVLEEKCGIAIKKILGSENGNAYKPILEILQKIVPYDIDQTDAARRLRREFLDAKNPLFHDQADKKNERENQIAILNKIGEKIIPIFMRNDKFKEFIIQQENKEKGIKEWVFKPELIDKVIKNQGQYGMDRIHKELLKEFKEISIDDDLKKEILIIEADCIHQIQMAAPIRWKLRELLLQNGLGEIVTPIMQESLAGLIQKFGIYYNNYINQKGYMMEYVKNELGRSVLSFIFFDDNASFLRSIEQANMGCLRGQVPLTNVRVTQADTQEYYSQKIETHLTQVCLLNFQLLVNEVIKSNKNLYKGNIPLLNLLNSHIEKLSLQSDKAVLSCKELKKIMTDVMTVADAKNFHPLLHSFAKVISDPKTTSADISSLSQFLSLTGLLFRDPTQANQKQYEVLFQQHLANRRDWKPLVNQCLLFARENEDYYYQARQSLSTGSIFTGSAQVAQGATPPNSEINTKAPAKRAPG